MSVVEDVDERGSLIQEIAAGLSELSRVERPPSEVDQSSEIEPDEVPTDDAGLLLNVVKFKDWLRVSVGAGEQTPTQIAAQLFAGVGADVARCSVVDGGVVELTTYGLTRLRDRVDRAVSFKDKFVEELEESDSLSGATSVWTTLWDDLVEESTGDPVVAKAMTWNIAQFAFRASKGQLNLSPSYQRGDVWPVKDRQLLIESILRGIPLPSVIILKGGSKGVVYEVVDGKQRLTSILMFMGSHPAALNTVEEADKQHPDFKLKELFRTDYTKFRRAWRQATGETLTATKEADYYFPFKVGSSLQGQDGALGSLVGKYYFEMKDVVLEVGGESVEIQDIFEAAAEYKIPLIEYSQATRRQIHEVFNLYNKQGKHLNAEEIRNAVYHEVELMRVLSVTARDNKTPDEPFLIEVAADYEHISVMLDEFHFGDKRYRKTKVLSWLFSLVFSESLQQDDKSRHRPLSTAQQTNSLLDRVVNNSTDPLRDRSVIRATLDVIGTAMESHSAVEDDWAATFKDNKNGAKWQELQLVASLVGICLVAVVKKSGTPQLLVDNKKKLTDLTARPEYRRPRKTQTTEQWMYIAEVALGLVDALDTDLDEVDHAMRDQFGFSPVTALRDAASSRQAAVGS